MCSSDLKVVEWLIPNENRYWFRINNFNGQLWRNARKAAEPQRHLAKKVFDLDFLHVVLTPESEYAPMNGPWVGESGRKLLLGFLYWAEEHIESQSVPAVEET